MCERKKRSCLIFHLPSISFYHESESQAGFLNTDIPYKLPLVSSTMELVLSLSLPETLQTVPTHLTHIPSVEIPSVELLAYPQVCNHK